MLGGQAVARAFTQALRQEFQGNFNRVGTSAERVPCLVLSLFHLILDGNRENNNYIRTSFPVD